MEKHENFFERLARERNITVEEMKQIISDRIEQGLHVQSFRAGQTARRI